jgi:ornithine cyclodeaminase
MTQNGDNATARLELPGGLLWLDGDGLRAALPITAAVEALRSAFAAPALPQSPPRAIMEVGSGVLHSMPAAGPVDAGVKLVGFQPENRGRGIPVIHGLYVLFDAERLVPRAVIDGAALTTLRTPAVSALATDLLARRDARHLVVFGAGVQARAHVAAMRAVRPIDRVTIVSRSSAGRELADELAVDVDAGVGRPENVAGADIVCTCTTSATPVFRGELLADGAHVNAIGAFTPAMREVDEALVARAAVTVDDREAALAEAGDLLIPIRAGAFSPDDIVADLAMLAKGADVRVADRDVTLFKSVGTGVQDLIVAAAAAKAAGA